MLRERFKARCIERATQDRERRVNGKRRVDLSSDGAIDFMDEDEEDDDAVLNDPVCLPLRDPSLVLTAGMGRSSSNA